MNYKYQPGQNVIVKGDSPEFCNEIVYLDHYRGNNTWVIVAQDGNKYDLKEKWFHDVTGVAAED